MSALRRAMQLRRDVTGRLYREWATARRRVRRTGSAERALDVFGSLDRADLDRADLDRADLDRADLEQWNQRTADRHDAYRDSTPPVSGRVAIICSSNRPTDLPNLLESVEAQRHDDLEFVFVAHGEEWDIDAARRACAALEGHMQRVQILQRRARVSLGACLNAALDATDARFVAKFDSDDHYGAHYLADSLRAHRYAGAGVVGKHSYYGHLEATDQYILRFPGREFSYTSTLAGGTLVIDRDIVGDQRFADVSIGEDGAFIRRCHRRGISTFAADRFNYTIVRTGANSWTISDGDFTTGAIVFDADWDPSQIER